MKIIEWPTGTQEIHSVFEVGRAGMQVNIPGRTTWSNCVVDLESKFPNFDIDENTGRFIEDPSQGDYVELVNGKYYKIYNIILVELLHDNVWRCAIDHFDPNSKEARKELEDKKWNLQQFANAAFANNTFCDC